MPNKIFQIDSTATKRFAAVVLLRSLFFAIIVFGLNRLIELGSSPLFIASGAVIGVVGASLLAFSRLRLLGFLALCAAAMVAYSALTALLAVMPERLFAHALSPHVLRLHLDLFMIALGIGSASTWIFWRSRSAFMLEALLLAASILTLLAGHRLFHFERPQAVNSLAWALGFSPLTTLVILGAALVALVISYLLVSSLPGRPSALAGQSAPRLIKGEQRVAAFSLALVATLILMFGMISIAVLTFNYYNREAQSRTASGVGQENKEQMSPLDFHSSLGSDRHPTALVRLEGDYNQNPFTPMLYFREQALSEFNGVEMVIASRQFDTDVNNTPPEQAYRREPDLELMLRIPLVQSIFLMAEHKTAFAVDYPLSITQLKNPKPDRFKAAYKSYSMVPAFDRKDMLNYNVGDPRWDEATRAHYLRPHPDQRYSDLGLKITANVLNPVEKAFAVTDFLSQNAIYTLTPGHEVKSGEDPVAPFLFGDMRGYCVHFAHAMTYMLRAVGVPARIGTGYLTDLSQSKDGHILLRTNDRHAWAEVYIESIGWSPFDPQPLQVESHAEAPVDMDVLEELMADIGPSEEILPPEVAADEAGLKIPEQIVLPSPKYLAVPVLAFLLLVLFIKLFLLYSWVFAADPIRRIRLYYRSRLAQLHDLGVRREHGETRQEFRRRVGSILGTDYLHTTDAVSMLAYYPASKQQEAVQVLGGNLQQSEPLKTNRLQKLRLLFSPAASLHTLTGGKW